MAAGRVSWSEVAALFERGDPAFVDALRHCDAAEELGAFAATWYADQRPAARQFLLDYLSRPLNSYRHEALVKRLFKLAEKAGNDGVMARFLVLFDRSIRRLRRFRRRYESRRVDSRAEAHALLHQWEAEGAESTNLYEWSGQFQVYGVWRFESVGTPRETTLPRNADYTIHIPWTKRQRLADLIHRMDLPHNYGDVTNLPDRVRAKLDRFRLFSLATRHYLRRRAWRYFRKLGKYEAKWYIPGVTELLKQYTDDDVADGLALLDNWGLVHILFHHSPVLVARMKGWKLASGRKLSELTPAPMYDELWKEEPRATVELLREAKCRPVRQWVLHRLRKDRRILATLPLEELLALLAHDDAEVVAVAAEALHIAPGLDAVPPERWLKLLESPNPAALATLCELVGKNVRADQVEFADALRLAMSRPAPLARLGLNWLIASRTREAPGDHRELLRLTEAECVQVRPNLVRWGRTVLSAAAEFDALWVLEYLDSRHADVRQEGWSWFQEDQRARDNVDLWRRLLESPYDDVRLWLVNDLEGRAARSGNLLAGQEPLDAAMVRLLWASVLLNIHRGNRAKPVVVQQIVRRLERRPEEAVQLLPLLSVALRSVRGPEWRAGLAGVMGLVDRYPAMETAVRADFPELKW